MSLQEIESAVEEIRAFAEDDASAHAAEDLLREKFIAYVATLYVPSLAAKASAVLKTKQIHFARRYV